MVIERKRPSLLRNFLSRHAGGQTDTDWADSNNINPVWYKVRGSRSALQDMASNQMYALCAVLIGAACRAALGKTCLETCASTAECPSHTCVVVTQLVLLLFLTD
jgi:hypothetical protein